MKHGTRSCYQSGCRRPECVEAQRTYNRAYQREWRKGRRRRINAAVVRRHLRELREEGIPYTTMAAVAGCHEEVVRNIVHGRQKTVAAPIAGRLMQVNDEAAWHAPLIPVRFAGDLMTLLAGHGVTPSDVARALRWKRGSLQLGGRYVTRRTYVCLMALAVSVGAVRRESLAKLLGREGAAA